jgi:hypothetical protein
MNTYEKKNIAVSDVGVACQRNMNIVGRKIAGSLIVFQRTRKFDFALSRATLVFDVTVFSSAVRLFLLKDANGFSVTNIATAVVKSGRRDVIENTNLHQISHLI